MNEETPCEFEIPKETIRSQAVQIAASILRGRLNVGSAEICRTAKAAVFLVDQIYEEVEKLYDDTDE
ncbi:hypothetical protein [Marinicella marina]|uniref:hypothetical protein n=1 Tax=Marinicella marina TaxID=2996016 RepID=UPI0024BD07DD|nr:hypothetical protein [Marinicella marina]MDJ1139621.1 hypothetical protein [Marinicella marina]